MEFGDLEVGNKFIDAEQGGDPRVFEKKSGTSAYDLTGDENGKLVICGKQITTKFTKSMPVIKVDI
jgi:hypothetical protein